jgi:hypothetical protein
MGFLSAEEVETPAETPSDTDSVHRWRHEQFVRLGFDDSQATLLAFCSHVDLGQVRGLIGRGCDRETLMRIVL